MALNNNLCLYFCAVRRLILRIGLVRQEFKQVGKHFPSRTNCAWTIKISWALWRHRRDYEALHKLITFVSSRSIANTLPLGTFTTISSSKASANITINLEGDGVWSSINTTTTVTKQSRAKRLHCVN